MKVQELTLPAHWIPRIESAAALSVGSAMKTHYVIRSLLALGLLAGCAASTVWAEEQSQRGLKAEATVPELEARKTALARVPGGTIKSAELERERDKLIWSFDIAVPKSRNFTEVQVDAKSGKIVSTKIETPADQAKEARADRKVRK